MYSVALENRRKFLDRFHREYRSEEFSDPLAIENVEMRKFVAVIKIADATVRQMEIKREVDLHKTIGGFAVLPDDKRHLPNDFADQEAIIKLWDKHRGPPPKDGFGQALC